MSSKEFIRGLIDIYRNHPCLWKTTSPEYTNKNFKNESYKVLVEYCKKYYNEADKTFVQQKIQNLRTAFRKELKKVEDSKRSGMGADDIYVPKLWYFELLLFTTDDVVPRKSLESRQIETTYNTDQIESDENDTGEEEMESAERETTANTTSDDESQNARHKEPEKGDTIVSLPSETSTNSQVCKVFYITFYLKLLVGDILILFRTFGQPSILCSDI